MKNTHEELNPKRKYTPGHNNKVADTLSRLKLKIILTQKSKMKIFGLDKDELSYELHKKAFPLKMSTIYNIKNMIPA